VKLAEGGFLAPDFMLNSIKATRAIDLSFESLGVLPKQ
jgi:hypothetical protein